jgi:AraC-like DNA-binding protein
MNNEETPYTVAEVAKLLNFSPQTVTRLFENESGVLIVERQAKKRNYRDPSEPHGAYMSVIRKLSVNSAVLCTISTENLHVPQFFQTFLG